MRLFVGMQVLCVSLVTSGWPRRWVPLCYVYMCACLCLLGTRSQPCCWLERGAWSSGSRASVRLPDLAPFPTFSPLQTGPRNAAQALSAMGLRPQALA